VANGVVTQFKEDMKLRRSKPPIFKSSLFSWEKITYFSPSPLTGEGKGEGVTNM